MLTAGQRGFTVYTPSVKVSWSENHIRWAVYSRGELNALHRLCTSGPWASQHSLSLFLFSLSFFPLLSGWSSIIATVNLLLTTRQKADTTSPNARSLWPWRVFKCPSSLLNLPKDRSRNPCSSEVTMSSLVIFLSQLLPPCPSQDFPFCSSHKKIDPHSAAVTPLQVHWEIPTKQWSKYHHSLIVYPVEMGCAKKNAPYKTRSRSWT